MTMPQLELWTERGAWAQEVSPENWDCPNWWSANYLMKISYIKTTSCGTHGFVKMIVFRGCRLEKSQDTIRLCGLAFWWYPQTFVTNPLQRHRLDIVVAPYLLRDSFSAQCFTGLLDGVSRCGVEDLASAAWSSRSLWGTSCSGWQRHVHNGGLDAEWIAWPPRSMTVTPMNFRVGTRSWNPAKNYRRSNGKNSGSRDNGWWQHVKACSKEFRSDLSRLPLTGQRPLRTPTLMKRFPWLFSQFDGEVYLLT